MADVAQSPSKVEPGFVSEDTGEQLQIAEHPLQIYTFGTLQVVRAGHTVTESDWNTRQARQLLKILLTERPRPVSTDRLIDLLWPTSSPTAAATTLRSAINALRNVLEPNRRTRAPSKYILTKAPGYALYEHDDIWLDVDQFEAYLQQAEAEQEATQQLQLLEDAVALYNDDYLTSDPYADWATGERERLRECYFAALLEIAALHASQGNYTAAIAACRRVVARDAVRENAYQAMMRYQAESGDSASALLTYERCRALLADELGADPSPLTQAWHQQILNGEIGPKRIDPTLHAQPETVAISHDTSADVHDRPQKLILPAQKIVLNHYESEQMHFVGRRAELALLTQHLTATQAGHGVLLVLAGEAGVGKTHLAHYLLRQFAGKDVTILHATCQPLEQQLPFAPFGDSLGHFLQTLPDELLCSLPAATLAQLAQLLPSLEDRLPNLPTTRVDAVVSNDENRQRLIDGFISLLTTLAEARPIIFFLDDLQWADTETLAVLGRLAHRLPQLPIFVLLAYRTGDLAENSALATLLHTLRRENPEIVQTIPRLDQREVGDLITQVTGQTLAEKSRFVTILYQATQGNPLFLTEALRALQERYGGDSAQVWQHVRHSFEPTTLNGQSSDDPSALTEIEPLDSLAQSLRVQEIILERFRRLPATARNLLYLCAVIGRDFSLDLLEAMATATSGTHLGTDLVTDLEVLLQRKFLVERSDERIDFSHQIVRQVAYEKMSVLQRRRLHLQVAEALALSPRVTEIPAEIAFHYRRAGRTNDHLVAKYCVLAGERLLQGYGFQQAIDMFEEALALLDPADATRNEWLQSEWPRSEWLGRALQGLGLAHESRFDPAGVTGIYRRLQQWARRQGDRQLLLTAYSRQTSMLGLLGQQRESNELLHELMSALTEDGIATGAPETSGILVMQDLFERRQSIYGTDSANDNGQWASYVAPPPVVQEPVTALLQILEPVHAVLPLLDYGWTLLVQGQLHEGLPCLEAVVALARETGQPSIAGVAYHQLALAARILGKWEDAYAYNEKSLAMNRSLQGRAGELASMWPRIGSAYAALQAGKADEAERRLRRVADFLQEIDAFRNHRNSTMIGLGLVALTRNQDQEAETLLYNALADAVHLYPYTHVQALLGLAQIASKRGDAAACRLWLQQSLHFAGERSLLEEYVDTLVVVAQLLPDEVPVTTEVASMLAYVQERGFTGFVAKLQ